MLFANWPNSRRLPALLAYLLVLAVWLPQTAHALDKETQASIRAFVENINANSMDFFSTDSEEEQRDRVRQLLASSFDVPGMAEYALGRAWKKANKSQRDELLEAFREDVVSAYLRRMRAPGIKLEFVGHREPVDEEHLAASRRTVLGKADQIWIWWLKPDGESWRVTDLSVDGHSALSTQGQEYGTVYIDNHGDIGAVLAFMRARAARPIVAE